MLSFRASFDRELQIQLELVTILKVSLLQSIPSAACVCVKNEHTPCSASLFTIRAHITRSLLIVGPDVRLIDDICVASCS